MPAKGSTTKTAAKPTSEDEPEDTNPSLPGAASLEEALAQQQKLADKNNRPADVADEDEFEPLDTNDAPTEVSSTDERPVSE